MSLGQSRPSENETIVIFDESDPISAIQALPPTVFPMTMKLRLANSTVGDTTLSELSTPDYPVDVRSSGGVYVPESTVYFDNPAEQAPTGTGYKQWGRDEFCDQLTELIGEIESMENTHSSNLTMTALSVVEINPRYTTSDRETGEPVATAELYNDEADMTIGYFKRTGNLTATQVRDALDTAMPGDSRSPPELFQVSEVTGKPIRSSRETQLPSGRHRYYTEAEATRIGKSDAVPRIWKLRRNAGPTESFRPLAPALGDYENFFPHLSNEDIVQRVTLQGETRTREQFYAEDVLSQ